MPTAMGCVAGSWPSSSFVCFCQSSYVMSGSFEPWTVTSINTDLLSKVSSGE